MKVREAAAKADAARRLVFPEYAESWDQSVEAGWGPERIIRNLRKDARKGIGRGEDIRYVGTGCFTLVPSWDEGRLIGFDVYVDIGTIKP